MTGLILLVGLTMLFEDIFYTAKQYLIAKSRSILASCCEVTGDICSLLTYGIGGVEVLKHGFSGTSMLFCVSVGAGSFAGTYTGLLLGKLLERT